MKYNKTFLILIVLLMNIAQLHSQSPDTLVFSVDDAKEYAINNNMLIRNAVLQTQSSQKKVWETIAQGLPQAGMSLDYIDYFNYELEFSFGGGGTFPPITDPRLDEGDQLILQILQAMFAPSEPTAIVLDNSSTIMFQINQLVFNGQYLVSIKTAKIADKITQQSLQKTQEDVKELVITAYYLVLLNEESLHILDRNMANLEKSLKQSEAMLIAGIAEQSDIDQIKIAYAALQNSKSAMQRNLELNYNLLRFQLGIEHDQPFILTDKLESIIKETQMEKPLDIPFNIENNINYKILSSQELLTKKIIDMEKMSYLPTIGAYYSYNEKLITTDFDMNPNNIAGLSLSWNIFTSNMRNSRMQQARIDYEIMQNTKQMMEEQLILQESQYRNDFKSALDNYGIQKESLQLSHRVYENIQRKYEQGIVSSLDLTLASDNYLAAQNNYLIALLNVLQSKLALDKILNNL